MNSQPHLFLTFVISILITMCASTGAEDSFSRSRRLGFSGHSDVAYTITPNTSLGLDYRFAVEEEEHQQVSRVELTGQAALTDFLNRLAEFKSVLSVRITSVDLTEVDISDLKTCQNLKDLNLWCCTLADDSLSWLPEAKQLKSLALPSSKNVDRNLRYVVRHREITDLHLESSDVSDSGVLPLHNLRQLKSLSLHCTGVSPDVVEKLIPLFARANHKDYKVLNVDAMDKHSEFTPERVQSWRRMVPRLDIYCDGK